MRFRRRRRARGEISARIDRLPATRTIWIAFCCSVSACSSSSDLLFSGYIAPSLVKSGLFTQTPGLFDRIPDRRVACSGPAATGAGSVRFDRRRGFHCGAVHRPVHRHDFLCGFLADKFGRRTIFTFSLLWYTAANVMVALQHDAFGLDVWRLISGIGLGLEMVTIGAYLSEMAPRGCAGRPSLARRRSASAACR